MIDLRSDTCSQLTADMLSFAPHAVQGVIHLDITPMRPF
jgi:hypothetical protein